MEFAYLVRPAFDRQFLDNATDKQRVVVGEHSDWLEARYAEGRVRFAGRCYDGPFALVVLDADSEEEARSLMEADPVGTQWSAERRALSVQCLPRA